MATVAAPAERVSGREVGGNPLGRILLYATLTLIAAFFLIPLLWMMVTAIKPRAEWTSLNWITTNPTLDNFRAVLNNPQNPVGRWFINSMVVASVITVLTLALDAMAGYAYARLDFPGKNILFGLLLATLVMPGIIFLIPNYITVATLPGFGLNTYQSLIAPSLAGVFGVFFMRQFFQGIPKELEEAAYIDGAGIWTTFARIALPLSLPSLSTLGIITFLAAWNEYLWPLLVMTQVKNYTLPVGLALLRGQAISEYGPIMAGAAITAIPVLVLYLLLQRYIIASVAMTGLKG